MSSNSTPQKRKASVAGIDGATQLRPVKRRASKACQSCRARKVRCNVTEHGAPCTNCRLDEVECTVSESRRKRKWSRADGEAVAGLEADTSAGKNMTRKIASRNMTPLVGVAYSASSGLSKPHDFEHVPHSIYQTTGQRLNLSLQALNRRLSIANAPTATPFAFLSNGSTSDPSSFLPQAPSLPAITNLPYFIKPLPARIGPDEIAFLEKKGALTVPSTDLRNELLRAYIEFVHPYMPLLELYDFVMIVESGSGVLGRISLILFQAVMFAGSAFVDMHHLHNAGYLSRKEARKDFFQKTRLLYDFDYESDRVALVQALLLLTYYYETPDDQKDTWHWMGVATSVAHTIGLHRNPERSSSMDSKTTKLWKRIWWSTYMRDRLIALGMRRPTRIKTEDFDVPMLTLDDFEFVAIPETVSCIPADCHLVRDVDKQRDLAIMCIEKAKLCLCISHVLSTQYCVLNNNQGIANDRTTMMLLPKKGNSEICEVEACDNELQRWLDELPQAARHRDTLSGHRSIDLHRSLLHMVFFSTLSALHRPQVLPSGQVASTTSSPASLDLLETSRKAVRRAADEITSLAQNLDSADLVRFLPTAGVTVLLPAIIIHLLDIKAPDESTRRQSLRGFCQCMQVMGKLRDLYAAADYSTAFLEAAIRKAGIHVAPFPSSTHNDKLQNVTTVEALVDAGRKLDMPPPTNLTTSDVLTRTLTPPPDISGSINGSIDGSIDVFSIATQHQNHLSTVVTSPQVTDEEVARRISTFLASTPPESDSHSSHHEDNGSSADTAPTSLDTMTLGDDDNDPLTTGVGGGLWGDLASGEDFKLFSASALPDFEKDDFDALLNFDGVGGGDLAWGFEDGPGMGWVYE